MCNITIRLEQPQDYREVENLTREAFWNVYRRGAPNILFSIASVPTPISFRNSIS